MVQYITIYKYSKLNLFGREQTLAKNNLLCVSWWQQVFSFPTSSSCGGGHCTHACVQLPLHCKKRLPVFPSPAGMSPTKLSLTGNNDVPAGDGKIGKPFITVYSVRSYRRISCKTGTVIGNEQLLIETWRLCHNYGHFRIPLFFDRLYFNVLFLNGQPVS
jgi:hypothetical protein